MGWWTTVTPRKLSRRHGHHPWTFATYTEAPSERSDGLWCTAFLFRDSERSVYGIREFCGDDVPHHDKLRDMATKVVLNKDFRKRLISDDPELPEMWERR
jgi:hypothetical protein